MPPKRRIIDSIKSRFAGKGSKGGHAEQSSNTISDPRGGPSSEPIRDHLGLQHELASAIAKKDLIESLSIVHGALNKILEKATVNILAVDQNHL
jgi:hypothetical protein